MSAEVFIDTNVFVYHLDRSDKRKHRIAEDIVRDGAGQRHAHASASRWCRNG